MQQITNAAAESRKKPLPGQRKPESEKLNRVISCRVTTEVGDMWDAKVDQAGFSASEFWRQALMQNKTVVSPAVKRRLRQKDLSSESEREILFLLQRQTPNINQIAHGVNVAFKAGIVSEKTFVAVLEYLQKVEAQGNVILSRVFV